MAAVTLGLAGVVASFALNLKIGVLLFLSAIGAAYLAMLLVLLLRQGFDHARSLGQTAEDRLKRIETLERGAKIPPIQIDRLHRAKQLAGLIERTVNGRRHTEDQSLIRNIEELDDLAGYLAEYPVHSWLVFFLEAAHVRLDQEDTATYLWGDPPSLEAKQNVKAELRARLELVQASCDKALTEGVPLKRISDITLPPVPPAPTEPS